MPDEEKIEVASSRLSEIADWIERDRREPDKVLCNVQSLRREILDLERADQDFEAACIATDEAEEEQP